MPMTAAATTTYADMTMQRPALPEPANAPDPGLLYAADGCTIDPPAGPLPISVIIPFYNGHRTIQRVLDSIDRQTARPSEIVLVDDGSSTPLRLSDLSSEVELRIVHHRDNRGIPAARNTGIRAARHEWLAFVDHDDEWMPEKLARQWRLLQEQSEPESMAFYGRCVWLEPAVEMAELFPGPAAVNALRRGGEAGLTHLLRRGLGVPFITLLVHRSLFTRYGALDEGIRGGSDDYELVLRLASKGVKFATSDFEESGAYSAIYHMGSRNHSRTPGFLDEECAFLRRFAQSSPTLVSDVRTALARSHFRAGRIYERMSRKDAARQQYVAALKHDFLSVRAWLALLGLPASRRLKRAMEAVWRSGRELHDRAASLAYQAQRWVHRA
jgi:glycosyltransferase involved in cell wall biosynthesis